MKNIESIGLCIANSEITRNRTAFAYSDGFIMNKICGIYKITSPSKKIYIGQSINILKRFQTYKSLHCEKQLFLYNSLKKYGHNKHKFEIIHQCLPEELNKLEKYYVDLFQCFNTKYGLNLRDGGGSNSLMRKRSKETLIKLSESHKGKTPPNKGIRMSDDQYEKCKNTMFKPGLVGIRKGVKLTEEHKLKLSISHTGKKLSKEHKMKISERMKISMIGNKNRCKK